VTGPTDTLTQILDLARWAPSGDNTQPWRFERLAPDRVAVHAFDTRGHCVYDLDGRPSQLSVGALIETAAIAASAHGLAMQAQRQAGSPDERPVFHLQFNADPTVAPSPLLPFVTQRSVQRLPLSTQPLDGHAQGALEAAVGPGFSIRWFAGAAQRRRWAGMLWRNAGLRLRLPEAFETHRQVIEWNARFSDDRIPDQALGVDAATRRLMRWGMASWARVDFMNRWLGGTIVPRLLMDVRPALACAAHVAILADTPPRGVEGQIEAGRAVQRFWLTATRLGLQHQPSMTPLIFARYVREGRAFTAHAGSQRTAQQVAAELDALLGSGAPNAVWLGRLGHGPAALARSRRQSLRQLGLDEA